jgi:hypothetical protein
MNLILLRIYIIILSFFITSASFGQVVYRDTVLSWNHFDYSLDVDNGMDWFSTTNIVTEEYPGIVLENEFVKLVILPEFGARIISFYYKPSGHEQFYTNPVGTPYGMNEGNFYYDWLMVMGGVFPTFPEPEHGKTWFLPWQWEIVEASDEIVSVQMQIKDTINFPGHPGKFNNGITEIICTSTVTLEKGKTSFELSHSLQNTKAANIPFEYWTCTTLAPGSEVGNTFTPANSEIIVPIEHVYLKDDWWSWMGNAEEPAPEMGNHVFEFKNLALYDNWEDMGIAYAHPKLEADFYGVINHENSEGVFRVSENALVTPGMKFWTWGADQGLNANPENFYHIARPYIELWSGISTQFFEDAYIAPNETISWTETYLPTLAMDSMTLVNETGAIHLNHDNGTAERFVVKLFTTSPDSIFALDVSLYGSTSINLYDDEFVSTADDCNQFTFYIDEFGIEDGDYELVAKLYDNAGSLAMESSIAVTLPYSAAGIMALNQSLPKLIRVSNNIYQLEFKEAGEREIRLFAISGQFIDQQKVIDNTSFIKLEEAGFYIIHVTEKGQSYSFKIVIE